MTYLVEITAITDAIGTSTVLRYATDAYNTGPSDSPANANYDARLQDPGSIKRDMFSDRTTSGQSRIGFGDIVLINNDGGLDGISMHGFDGQPVVLRFGADNAAYPGGFATVFSGTIATAEFDLGKVVIKVRDKLEQLNLPVAATRYAGNNALPAGLEGTTDNIKGQPKPRAYGTLKNISPVYVNTSKLTYQVHNGTVLDIVAVYDRGSSITKGADFATSALLQAASPAAATYITCFAEGYFRLGSTPAGQITADVTQGAAAANRTAAQILKQLALDVGLPAGDISAADVTALDTANSAELGLWVSDDSAALSALDEVAASVGAWYGFDRTGVLRMGRVIAPAGTPAAVLTTLEVVQIERLPSNDTGKGLPIWRATVNYAKNYTVQPSDLAGAVTATTRAYLALGVRGEQTEDAAIKIKHKLAPEMTRDTLIVTQAAAATEAARLLALHKVERETYQVDVWLDTALAQSLDLGNVVSLAYPRFGLTAGKLFIVTGIDADFARGKLKLTLWG